MIDPLRRNLPQDQLEDWLELVRIEHNTTEDLGPTLTDKTTGLKYRIIVDNGILGIEQVI